MCASPCPGHFAAMMAGQPPTRPQVEVIISPHLLRSKLGVLELRLLTKGTELGFPSQTPRWGPWSRVAASLGSKDLGCGEATTHAKRVSPRGRAPWDLGTYSERTLA